MINTDSFCSEAIIQVLGESKLAVAGSFGLDDIGRCYCYLPDEKDDKPWRTPEQTKTAVIKHIQEICAHIFQKVQEEAAQGKLAMTYTYNLDSLKNKKMSKCYANALDKYSCLSLAMEMLRITCGISETKNKSMQRTEVYLHLGWKENTQNLLIARKKW
jgi:hypothetical protein